MPYQWVTNSATNFTALDFSTVFQGSPAVSSASYSSVFAPGADTMVTVLGATQTATLMGTGFTFDAGGALTGGTILGLEVWESGTYAYDVLISYINLDVADFMTVALTATLADDAALVRQMFRGNDRCTGSTESDLIVMGGGKDYYMDGDYGTFDTVFGGAGDDYFDGFDGGRLVGGAGNDVVVNYFTLGRLRGGTGDDTLQGGSDRDVMAGGSGADSFLFRHGQGHDVVRDFTQGQDRLVMVDFAASMADLTIWQQGSNTRISFGSGSVLLKGVNAATLTDNDFVFGQPTLLQDAIDAFYSGWDFLP